MFGISAPMLPGGVSARAPAALVAHGAQLRHPVSLADRGADPLLGAAREIGVQRCGAARSTIFSGEKSRPSTSGVGEREDHRRGDVQPGDSVILDDSINSSQSKRGMLTIVAPFAEPRFSTTVCP